MSIQKRVRTHSNPLGFYHKMTPIPLEDIFPSFSGVLDFEIGSGRGKFIQNYAQIFPNRHILGVEIRKALVDNFLELLPPELKNAHMIHTSSERCLSDMIPDQSIERCFIFHPDPWFKKRHHKRRVVHTSFLAQLHSKLSSNGRLYISSDVDSLWEDMTECLRASPLFEPIADPEFWGTVYKSHWSEFSIQENRIIYQGTWQKKAF